MTQEAPIPSPGEAAALKRLKRSRFWQALFFSIIIFISGGACGWGISHIMHGHQPPRDNFAPDPPVDRIIAEMSDELVLTKQQSMQLTEIYRARFAALSDIRKKMLPQFKTEYDELRTQVQKVLTPEQFKKWSTQFEAVRDRMMPPPPPPPPPPRQSGPGGQHADNNGLGDRGPNSPGPNGPGPRSQ